MVLVNNFINQWVKEYMEKNTTSQPILWVDEYQVSLVMPQNMMACQRYFPGSWLLILIVMMLLFYRKTWQMQKQQSPTADLFLPSNVFLIKSIIYNRKKKWRLAKPIHFHQSLISSHTWLPEYWLSIISATYGHIHLSWQPHRFEDVECSQANERLRCSHHHTVILLLGIWTRWGCEQRVLGSD